MRDSLEESLASAVDRLGEVLERDEDSITRDAAIQRFEFCFELAWKSLQARLRSEGLDCGSPRSCLQGAFRLGWIEDRSWLEMLSDRNLTSHTYDEELARQVYARLSVHVVALRALLGRLRDDASESPA